MKKDPDPTALQLGLLKEIKEQAALSEPYIAKGMELALNGQSEEAYKYLRYQYRPVQKNGGIRSARLLMMKKVKTR